MRHVVFRSRLHVCVCVCVCVCVFVRALGQFLLQEIGDVSHAVKKVQDGQQLTWAVDLEHEKCEWTVLAVFAHRLVFVAVCMCTCVCVCARARSRMRPCVNPQPRGVAVMRAAAESTNARMLWFSFAEALTLVALSIWRVISLRNFFEQRGSF